MTGHSDPRAGDRPDALDLLSRAAASGMSRRQVAKLGGALALTALLPEWAVPARAADVAHAAAKTTGSCPSQRRGPCGAVRGRWTPTCKTTVPNGRTSAFNGCGPQNGVDLPVLGHGDWVPDRPLGVANFFDACKGHDCCYGRCGSKKADCDEQFLEAMRDTCMKSASLADLALLPGLRMSLCMSVAEVYHQAVSSTDTGQSAFDAGQAETCDCCQSYTVRFDSKIDLTATGSDLYGTFHLDYTAEVVLTTPSDGSAYASGSAQGGYAEALGTVTDGIGDDWTLLGATGDTFRVVDFNPGTGGAATITLEVGSPRETYDFGGVVSGIAPLWSWAFFTLHQQQALDVRLTLPLTASGATATDGTTVVAQGLFEASADLGSAAGGPPLDLSATEHTAITVTAIGAS
jgi:hypothetical protein